MQIKVDNWIYEDYDDIDERDSFIYIFTFMYDKFIELFSIKNIKLEPCLIFVDKNAECPRIITNCNPIKIRVTVNYSIWNQFIFQLSHELCHYFIRQYKKNKNASINWFEETICEAMSLYMLDFFRKKWFKSKLKTWNPNYLFYINSYLQAQLTFEGISKLKSCKSINELREIEDTCQEQERRNDRRQERILLYKEICKNPLYAKCFLDYPTYISLEESLLIDFDKWKKDDPNNKLIIFLQTLQPTLIEV